MNESLSIFYLAVDTDMLFAVGQTSEPYLLMFHDFSLSDLNS